MFLRKLALLLCLTLAAACAKKDDLAGPTENLGDFVLGLNIVVTDNMQKVPISRDATPEQWQSAIQKAVQDRFGRYQGNKIYNIGIAVDGFALAPPGIPLVLAPKSILVISPSIFDDAAGKQLNTEPKQITAFERGSSKTFIGSGITQNAEEQMAELAFVAVRSVEDWFLENPEWFGLPPRSVSSRGTVER